MPARSQAATLRDLGDDAQRALVSAYVDAWARADAGALASLLARDVRFSMPPIPNWYDGVDAVLGFCVDHLFRTPWRLVPMRASGQLAFACYQGPDYRLGALNIVALGREASGATIVDLTGFLDPAIFRRFSLPER